MAKKNIMNNTTKELVKVDMNSTWAKEVLLPALEYLRRAESADDNRYAERLTDDSRVRVLAVHLADKSARVAEQIDNPVRGRRNDEYLPVAKILSRLVLVAADAEISADDIVSGGYSGTARENVADDLNL